MEDLPGDLLTCGNFRNEFFNLKKEKMATNIITIALSVLLIISLLFEKKVYHMADKINESRTGLMLVVLAIITIGVFLLTQA